jgi:hypothetical protein
MAAQPLLLGSTDFQHWIPHPNRRSNVTIKSRAEPTQRLPGRPLAHLAWGLSPLGLHITYTPVVLMILTLVNFTLSCLDISDLVPKFLK